VVSSTPRPHFTSGKEPVTILQEAGWALGPVWTGGNSCPHRDSIPDGSAFSRPLYQLSYRAHNITNVVRYYSSLCPNIVIIYCVDIIIITVTTTVRCFVHCWYDWVYFISCRYIPHYRGFTITLTRTTVSRTLLDE